MPYLRTVYAVMLVLMIFACSQTTTIKKPDGSTYEVIHSRDAIVEFTDGEERVKVDDRGREGIFESIMKVWVIKELNEDKDE